MCVEHTSPVRARAASVQRCPGSLWLGFCLVPGKASFQLPVCSAERNGFLGIMTSQCYPCPFPSELQPREGKALLLLSGSHGLFPTSARASPWFKSLPRIGGSCQDSAPLLQGAWVPIPGPAWKILYAALCDKKNQTNKSKIIPDFANVPRIPPVPSEDGLQVP